MVRHHGKAGEILFREGEPSRFIYRLVSGQVEVIRSLPSGGSEVIGHILTGEFIGEMGVLVASRRGGTARFLHDSEVERFTRTQFLKLIWADPVLSGRLLHTLSLRTRSQFDLLEDLSASSAAPTVREPMSLIRRWALGALAWLNERIRSQLKSLPLLGRGRHELSLASLPEHFFSKGSRLFAEGDPSDRVYWIQSGRVRINRQIDTRSRRMGFVRSKEFLGEMGVLESLPRAASAWAATNVTARVLTPAQFNELMQDSHSAYFAVLDSLCERARRLRQTIRILSAKEGRSSSAQTDVFEVVRSIDSVAQLAEHRLVDEAIKMRQFFQAKMDNAKFMAAAYQRYLRGEASKEEMEKANAHFRDYVKLAGLGTLLILPGAVLTIPLAAKLGKVLGVDIFPAEVLAPETVTRLRGK